MHDAKPGVGRIRAARADMPEAAAGAPCMSPRPRTPASPVGAANGLACGAF